MRTAPLFAALQTMPSHADQERDNQALNVAARWNAVRFCYAKQKPALKDFSLEVRLGETLALLGPNGAGKSTAVKLLLGLLACQSGSVSALGLNPRSAQARGRIGSVLQTQGLPAQLSVLEQLQLQASYFPSAQDPLTLLETLNLTPLKDRRLNALSGGEKRRLELAMALIGNPQLLVLDEPTAGVDINERARILALLSALRAQGMSMLLTTHLIDEAERLADRVAYLQDGQLHFVGPTEALQRRAGLTRLEFSSELAPEALYALAAAKGASAPIALGAPGAKRWCSEAQDIDPMLRELLAQDPVAKVLRLSPLSLEDALRALRQSLNTTGESECPHS
jgi:ABC-2 type transport system ATP-binding protein